jgi:hypothetical protein
MANFNITNVGNIGGSVKTTAVNNIVSNAGGATAGHVAVFSDTSGKVLQDSGASFAIPTVDWWGLIRESYVE